MANILTIAIIGLALYLVYRKNRNYYLENYPQIAVENGRIDALILMTTGGY